MRSLPSDELRHEKGESASSPRTPPRANENRMKFPWIVLRRRITAIDFAWS